METAEAPPLTGQDSALAAISDRGVAENDRTEEMQRAMPPISDH